MDESKKLEELIELAADELEDGFTDEKVDHYKTLYSLKTEENQVGWEADYRYEQLKVDSAKNNKLDKKTVVTLATVGGITIAGMIFEARGYIMPKLTNLFKFIK